MTQHLDLDALQAELEWCIAEGHSGPRTHACLKSLQPLIDRLRKAEAASKWLPIETAPKDGSEVWAYNGEQVRMKYLSCEEWHGWIYADALLSEADAAPEQPTYYMPIPAAPDSTPTDSAEREGAKG